MGFVSVFCMELIDQPAHIEIFWIDGVSFSNGDGDSIIDIIYFWIVVQCMALLGYQCEVAEGLLEVSI